MTVSPQTLARYATEGTGPLYNKFAHFPLYEPADLDAWAVQQLGPKVRSSTELKALEAARAPA